MGTVDRDSFVDSLAPKEWNRDCYHYMMLIRDRMTDLKIHGSGMCKEGSEFTFGTEDGCSFEVMVRQIRFNNDSN